MSNNTLKIIQYLQGVNGADVTAKDVAEALDMGVKSVDCAFTHGICRKGLGLREEAEVLLQDGTSAKVKFFKLTDEGFKFVSVEA